MKGSKLSKVGGICSILVGISYIVVGITYLLRPAEQRPGADPVAFLTSFAQNPLMSTLMYWAFALGAVFAIAAVLAVSEMVLSLGEGWVRWTSNLAVIGFAVTTLNNFRYLAYYPSLATAYATGDAAAKAAAASSQSVLALDPYGWLIFGGVGLWFLVINLLALGGNTWPKTVVCWDCWRNRVPARSGWLRFPGVHPYLNYRSSGHCPRADLVHLGWIDTTKSNLVARYESKILGQVGAPASM